MSLLIHSQFTHFHITIFRTYLIIIKILNKYLNLISSTENKKNVIIIEKLI